MRERGGNSAAAAAAPADDVAILERDGRTPAAPLRPTGFLSACAADDDESARRLAAGAAWMPAHAADKHGSTALMWAASHGALAAMRFLVEEARVGVDARNKMGRTALMWACKYGRLEAARYLLHDAGADAMARMRDGSTAFDWAVFGGHRPTMDLVADHPSVDLTALNRFGCAAVQWAAAAGSVDTCRWLRARGLELGHVNPAGHGAVGKAAWQGHRELLSWLVAADDGPQLAAQLAARDAKGRLPSELARDNGHPEVGAWLEGIVGELGCDGGVGLGTESAVGGIEASAS